MSWSIKHGPDITEIKLNGKELTEEKEIIEFIDTIMKPVDIDAVPNPEAEWEFMRATNVFQFLFKSDNRVEVYVKSFCTGENLTFVIHRHVKMRYPDLGWMSDEAIEKAKENSNAILSFRLNE